MARGTLRPSNADARIPSVAASPPLGPRNGAQSAGVAGAGPIVHIRLFGGARVEVNRRSLSFRAGSRSEALLLAVALAGPTGISRDALRDRLWPHSSESMAGQSLNSLTHSLHKLLGRALNGQPPIVYRDRRYRLNHAAGVGADVVTFDARLDEGVRLHRLGDVDAAVGLFREAVRLYTGDLPGGPDVEGLVEREHHRARYVMACAELSKAAFASGQFEVCVVEAQRLLASDACSEEGHRFLMKSFVRLRQRSLALRQYRICAAVLRAEFNTDPEPSTTELFERIRDHPDLV